MRIITNNQGREIIEGWQLTGRERKEFDYINDKDINDYSFFRYKGNVYDISDFMKTDIEGWHGIMMDTFFSCVLIKFTSDYEYIIVGRYYA